MQQQDLEQLKQQHQRSQQQAFRFILTQFLATIILFAILLLINPVVTYVVAYSSLIGGLIATLTNAWFAIKIFRVKPTVAAKTLQATFYVGEMYKIILTGSMFLMAFVLVEPLSAAALLLTYLLIHLAPAVQSAFTKD